MSAWTAADVYVVVEETGHGPGVGSKVAFLEFAPRPAWRAVDRRGSGAGGVLRQRWFIWRHAARRRPTPVTQFDRNRDRPDQDRIDLAVVGDRQCRRCRAIAQECRRDGDLRA